MNKEEIKKDLQSILKCNELEKEDKLRELSKISRYSLATLKKEFSKYEKEVKEKEKANLKEINEAEKMTAQEMFSRRSQVEAFWKVQPFFYDKSKLFWIWDKEFKKWVLSDEVEFLNSIRDTFGIETIESKARTELIEAFKQIGRKHKPEPARKSWIQLKEKIYDVKTKENFEASPKYFITNPIPWKIGDSEKTPEMDKLFTQWVGKDHIKELYEFIAYSSSMDQFMQRIFAFCGGGSNGKGTFIKLVYKFLGKENCVSSELKALSEDKFEPAILYRKLLCVMGEVSYGDLKNTNQIKKIAGEDQMSFQYKGKTPFSDDNTATCVSLTNSLPATPDKSTGFYRKWYIADFPNQFTEIKKDLIESIPEQEFENLSRKIIRILNELYETRKFTNEGNFEERIQKYEEHSNPVMKFVEEFCEEIPGESISIRDFTNKCNDFHKEKHLRILSSIQIGKILREEGFAVSPRKINGVSSVVILNLSFKKCIENYSNYSNYSKVQQKPYKETNEHLDSSNSSNSFLDKNKETLDTSNPKNKSILEDFE